MELHKLNYDKLMALEPTEYGRAVNQLEQEIIFYEHPTQGDYYPVIAAFPEFKIAVCTDFYDLGDFCEGSEYMPVYIEKEGIVVSYFELIP